MCGCAPRTRHSPRPSQVGGACAPASLRGESRPWLRGATARAGPRCAAAGGSGATASGPGRTVTGVSGLSFPCRLRASVLLPPSSECDTECELDERLDLHGRVRQMNVTTNEPYGSATCSASSAVADAGEREGTPKKRSREESESRGKQASGGQTGNAAQVAKQLGDDIKLFRSQRRLEQLDGRLGGHWST